MPKAEPKPKPETDAKKFKTPDVRLCLDYIGEFLNADCGKKKEYDALKKKAKKAHEHLSELFNPEAREVKVRGNCPGHKPTI